MREEGHFKGILGEKNEGREALGGMDGWMGGWVDGWVDGFRVLGFRV